QHEFAAELDATKDRVKRQQKTLRSLQVLLSKGSNISALLPAVVEVATASDTQRSVRQDAIQVVAGIFSYPQARMQCSMFSEVLGSAVTILQQADESGAAAILAGLEQLKPEDFIRLLGVVEPETLIRRVAEHRSPAVRPMAVRSLGESLVRAWPCVSAGQDENLRDSCMEAFRVIFGLLSSSEAATELRASAAAVLDALLAAYLNVTPAPLATVALLNPLYSFVPIYATLIMEMLYDLKSALPLLCASGGSLVTRTCIWVPTKEQAVAVGKAAGLDGRRDSVSLPESDWPFVASEAAGFRAALLWILAFGGGLSRTEPDGGRSVSPLMLELAREVGSGRVGSRLPPLKELPPPPDALRAELEKCPVLHEYLNAHSFDELVLFEKSHLALPNRTAGWHFVTDPDSRRCLGAKEHIANELIADKVSILTEVINMTNVVPDLLVHDDNCTFEHVKNHKYDAFGTIKHFVIDKFHMKNHKCSKNKWTRSEKSRCKGVNTSQAEQFNAWMRGLNFFLNGLRPASHRFWVTEAIRFYNDNLHVLNIKHRSHRTNTSRRVVRKKPARK
ncbi:unnamed protein product, partial [Polarella glacialis]